MAKVKCPKCKDPNFEDGACGCGWCEKCFWRQTCTQGGWYDEHFGDPNYFAGQPVMNDIKLVGDGLPPGVIGIPLPMFTKEQVNQKLNEIMDGVQLMGDTMTRQKLSDLIQKHKV